MVRTLPKQKKTEPAPEPGNTAKRSEIFEGARQVFRAEGFAGASMDKIAQTAGVSKGTLYVYFRNKEELFQELVTLDRKEAAEQLCRFDDDNSDVRDVLQRLGESFVSVMAQPDHIALIRMVMGAAEKFPDAGRTFYETGPKFGTRRLAAYLERQVAAGRLRIDDDIELAAVHFFNLCQGDLVKRLLFNVGKRPSAAESRATVTSAVRIFMAAYGL